MHSVNITIEGSYWDSQIYSGELLLFDNEGALHRIYWGHIIDGMATKNPSVQTAIRVAFSDSDLFYNPKVRRILIDPLIESPIKEQLSKLAVLSLSINMAQWGGLWSKESTPFDFLPTDTEIYYNTIFAGGDGGLFSFPRQSSANSRFSKDKLTRHHDARVFQVKASERFTAIATASGNDGLFDFSFSRSLTERLGRPRQIAGRPCSACDWAFQSVMGWSSGGAFLASFREEQLPDSKKKARVFDRVIDQQEMFNSSPFIGEANKNIFTWGSREKIYRLTDNGIHVSSYNGGPNKSKSNHEFSAKGFVSLYLADAEVISTGTAPFGTVIELGDRLLVIRSDGLIDSFDEEPVHWRIFPRSEHYSNQLHIIYEDRVVIVSYVHDYFVDQGAKLSGFSRGGRQNNENDSDIN